MSSAHSDSAQHSPTKKRKLSCSHSNSSSHEVKTEEPNTMEPPPLEKLTVDLTAESDKENKANTSDSSAHSLSPPSPQKQQNDDNDAGEEDDEDDDLEEEEEEEESSSDEENPLFANLSKEDKLKMKQKMGLIQNEFEEHEKKALQRRCEEIQERVKFVLSMEVDDEVAAFIDELIEHNVDNLEEKLEDEGCIFLRSVDEMMKERQKHSNDNDGHHSNSNNAEAADEEDEDYQFSDDENDADWVQETKRKKAARAAKRKNVAKHTNLDGSTRCGRLLLNDALQDVENQTKWSDARKKAWANRKTQQNAYFYRFNVPGQPQKNGKWTQAEHELFMKQVLALGVNDQWGIFSKKIPGRVGYQCSNYWRGLVKDGDVIDPNYHIDEETKKLHFARNVGGFVIPPDFRKFAVTINRDASGVFKDLPTKHPRHPSDAVCKEVKQALAGQFSAKMEAKKSGSNGTKNKKKRTNKRKRNEDDEDGDDDDEEWNASSKPAAKRRKQSKRKPRMNRKRRNDDSDDEDDDDDGDEAFYCKTDTTSNYDNDEDEIEELKDFVDIMTGMKVCKPTISPHGHVLGYDTWTKILRTSKHKDLCPFTLQRMTRRSLVKLTRENYDEYKHKIINVTEQQMQLMGDMSKDD